MKLCYWIAPFTLLLAGCGQADGQADSEGPALSSAAAVTVTETSVETDAVGTDIGNAIGPAMGERAPEFELPGSDGKTHKLSNYRGDHVVLAFFPKAFTGG